METDVMFYMTHAAKVQIMVGKDIGHCLQLGGDPSILVIVVCFGNLVLMDWSHAFICSQLCDDG